MSAAETSKPASATNAGSSSGTPVVVSHARSSVPLLAGMAVLTILGGGGSAWFVMNRARTAEASRATPAPTAPKYILHLEGFTVNLADPEETHFLRATIDLGVDHLPEGSEKDKTVALPVPRIRDALLSVLTVCKADVLLTADGKAQLKKNLVDVLNRNVPELGVREVYFSEFLVQR